MQCNLLQITFILLFNDFTVQAIKVVLVSPEVCSINFLRTVCLSLCTIFTLAGLSHFSIRSAPNAEQETWIDVIFAKYPSAEQNKHPSLPSFSFFSYCVQLKQSLASTFFACKKTTDNVVARGWGQVEALEFVICLISKFMLWVRWDRRYILEVEKCECLFMLSWNPFSFLLQSINIFYRVACFLFFTVNVVVLSSSFSQIVFTQCLQPSETCDSLSLDNIVVMMMNTKTSTKPLVVVNGSGPPDITG